MEMRHMSWEEIVAVVESASSRRSPGAGDPSAAEGRLGAADGADVLRHLAECPRCEELAGSARALLALLCDAALPPVPEPVVQRSMARVRQELESMRAGRSSRSFLSPLLARAGRRVEGALIEMWATLVADSARPNHAVRAGAQTGSRTVLFETSDYSVSIAIESGRSPGRFDVMGQVVPRRAEGLPAERLAGLRVHTFVLGSPVSEFGEFVFRDAPPGPFHVEIALGDSLVRLAPFEGPIAS